MTNIFAAPEKSARKTQLFDLALQALAEHDYLVERVKGSGKSSLRRITKGGKSQIATIRTSQDCWIAFPRNENDVGWNTLDDADVVVAVSVDDKYEPRFANIHLIPADEMRKRYDRARDAKLRAGHVIPEKRGVWLSLYKQEANQPVNLVGAGAGIEYPPIAQYELELGEEIADAEEVASPPVSPAVGERFTIADAKKKLSAFYDVPESAITITISH
jgi:hypothetical protein